MNVQSAIRRFAARQGVLLQRQTGSGDRVLSQLRPHSTEHPLIRMGGDADGGYLVPDDLDGITACFSPGVDQVATFEQECIDRGMHTFQIDASVERSPLVHPRNQFDRKFLGIETVGNTITLDDWVASKAPAGGDLILQMDIEGHEWLTLAHVSDAVLARFRIIVLELHFLPLLFADAGDVLFAPVIDKLKRKFEVVHMHVNNVYPSVAGRRSDIPHFIEVTLLRRDRFTRAIPLGPEALPHPLDRENVPDRAPVAIPPAVFS
ncbi:FkbM family methyltransferase [Novosphingobium huizhouense]|uniref:FkbM family methyltransferase n=1 Tax=Novosphingobium huizhouense TaxID=2866625 RepID=UPI001CD8CE24|nr:FkbM family methyltransferase [Novosphingobium huizhouense]